MKKAWLCFENRKVPLTSSVAVALLVDRCHKYGLSPSVAKDTLHTLSGLIDSSFPGDEIWVPGAWIKVEG